MVSAHDNEGPGRENRALASEGVAVDEVDSVAGASFEERGVGQGYSCVWGGRGGCELEEGGEEGEEEHLDGIFLGG